MIDITKYLNQQLTHKARTGYDKYGKIQTVSTNIKGRLVYNSLQNRGLQAKPLDYDVEVWLEPTQVMAVEDIIADYNNSYRVLQVNEYRAKDGSLHHKKALCQKYV
jgi:hypothetical protein